ncbi:MULTISPECIES: glycosyltransferase family 4 protein [unclassified Serratia (in: enterobacteria)]|uniref:glycosyltransferase family 4 protein n=1 Tax=unclassified Serratia (in: enterobacteria) TaxID=2647522 RepID=UPI002ED66FCA|nr:glycosyltransferase family 4 protein [Serratia sp. C2(2)]MEE4446080.1 glycosyltransferase family 4 protein [Serratia sp. C2(1)]
MQQRKVAIVIENIAEKGGTERVASSLANALSTRLGHQVDLVSISGERAFYPLEPEVRLRFMSGRTLLWPWRLARFLRRGRYDVIVTVSMGKLSSIMVPYLRLLCPNSRLLLSEHVSFHQYAWPMKWLKVLVYRLGDRTVLLTRKDLATISRWVPEHKCRVIENVSPFPIQPPQQAPLPVALAVGRLCYQKGFDRLIAAWQRAAPQTAGWQLHIVGDGPDRAALQQQIDAAGLGEQVKLLPATPDIASHYRRAGMLLMTSRYEGLPMVLIEAMSFGLPLVAFDCQTGPAELIDDGGNGYLVPEGDIDAFSQRTLALIADGELRKRFSLHSLERAQQYIPERIYPQWQQLMAGG